jgi:hypothetical protein
MCILHTVITNNPYPKENKMDQITRIILEKIHEATTAILSLPTGIDVSKEEERVVASLAPPAVPTLTPAPPTPEPPKPVPTLTPAPPTPEPPKPVPMPAPIPMPAADPSVELDSEGLPWDDRIHGSGQTFLKADGTWKLKRGVDAVLVAKVKTELRGKYPAPGREPAPAPAPAPAPEPPTSCDNVTSWAELNDFITQDNIDPELVESALAKFNVPSMESLKDVPVLIPLIYKELV